MADVFVSNARSTRASAQTAAEVLREPGYTVWLDDALPAHRADRKRLDEQLAVAPAVLALWSKDAAESSGFAPMPSERAVSATGKRKDHLTAALEPKLKLFDPRILPFDTEAARRYADQVVNARPAVIGFLTPDGYIGAIAAAHQLAVASRDTSPFIAAQLTVINPWTARR